MTCDPGASSAAAAPIRLTHAENPRYTIWRALNPDGHNWHFMAWIREQWAECAKSLGSSAGPTTAHQEYFTEWLRVRHRAEWV